MPGNGTVSIDIWSYVLTSVRPEVLNTEFYFILYVLLGFDTRTHYYSLYRTKELA